MGILDKLPFKRHHESPPDFTDIPTNTPTNTSIPPDNLSNTQGDPTQGFQQYPQQQYPQPFDQQDPLTQGAMDDQTGLPPSLGTHGNYMNVGHEPSGGDRARAFAQSLQSPGMGQSTPSSPRHQMGSWGDLSLILERLDTIKAELDAIKQRMYRLDQYLDSQSKRKYW